MPSIDGIDRACKVCVPMAIPRARMCSVANAAFPFELIGIKAGKTGRP